MTAQPPIAIGSQRWVRIGGGFIATGGALVTGFLPSLVGPMWSLLAVITGAVAMLAGLTITFSPGVATRLWAARPTLRQAFLGVLLIVFGGAAGWYAAPRAESDRQAAMPQADERVQSMRALLPFVEAWAIPAFDQSEDLMQTVSGREEDSDLRNLVNNYLLSRPQGVRAEMMGLLRGEESANGLVIAESVCAFFRAYDERIQWIKSLGQRNGYDFDSADYKRWLRADQQLEEYSRPIVVDSRYGQIKACLRLEPEWRIE